MDETDHKILAFMEKGITLAPKPFSEIAHRLRDPPEEVVARLGALKEKGVIRRFGASIKPNNVGFFANALVAWKVPESRVQETAITCQNIRKSHTATNASPSREGGTTTLHSYSWKGTSGCQTQG